MTNRSNVYAGQLNLTSDQQRFRKLLEGYPKLLPYWDFEKVQCHITSLQVGMQYLNDEERHMARFFVALWQPDNALQFDIMDALRTLGDDDWLVVQKWLSTVEYPGVTQRMMKRRSDS